MRKMEQEIRVYLPIDSVEVEYELMMKEYTRPLIIYCRNQYYIASVERGYYVSGWRKMLMERNGFYYINGIEESGNSFDTIFVPECSIAVIREATIRACRKGVLWSIPQIEFYVLEGEAIRSLSDTPVEALKDLYAYRQFLLMVGQSTYWLDISTIPSSNPRVNVYHDYFDNPAVIERVKNHLLEHGYLAMDASVNISMTEMVEI